eukprot:jgi/Chlat1/6771/Chrsp50S06469
MTASMAPASMVAAVAAVVAVLLVAIAPAGTSAACVGEQSYAISFKGAWTPARQPRGYPTDAHFSTLAGAAHSGDVELWRPGQIARKGLKEVALTGETQALQSVVDEVDGDFIALSSRKTVAPDAELATTVTVSSERPFLSLVAHVGPSPDWFVGVSSQSLCMSDTWVSALTVELIPYDAGVNSGNGFTVNGNETSVGVRMIIPNADAFPVFNENGAAVTPLAFLTFTKVSTSTIMPTVRVVERILAQTGTPPPPPPPPPESDFFVPPSPPSPEPLLAPPPSAGDTTLPPPPPFSFVFPPTDSPALSPSANSASSTLSSMALLAAIVMAAVLLV